MGTFCPQPGRQGLALDGQLAPLARTAAKSPFETGIEEAHVVEAAVFGDVNHFGITISQEGYGFQQAHFHLETGYRNAEVLMKQAIEVPPAAIESRGQFLN